jgi:hypothetical protein
MTYGWGFFDGFCLFPLLGCTGLALWYHESWPAIGAAGILAGFWVVRSVCFD